MDISTPLFVGEHISLGPIDHEKDAEIESRWTHDPTYLRMLYLEPARPLPAAVLKKRYENIEKEATEGGRLFYFTIRMRCDGPELGRLIGFVKLNWIEWTNGGAYLQLAIGDPADRGHGYGAEALGLIMRFAFEELNLFRLSVMLPEYNEPGLRLLKKAGFVEEARRRQVINRDGRRYDMLHLGLLKDEWPGHEYLRGS